METAVIKDEQVGREEGPEGTVQRVVHPILGHGLEEVIGVAEADGVSGADGRVAQGLCQETLADANRSSSWDRLVFVEKLRSTIHGYRQGNPALS